MPVEAHNPEALPKPQGFAHLSIEGSKIVHIAGQTTRDADGNLVGAVLP